MADSVHVKGLDQLQKFLDQVPAKIEANVMRGALRAGMNVVKPVAQSNVHSVSGKLAAGLKIGTRRRGSVVTSYLKVTGPHAFIGHMLEFTGAAAHQIVAKFAGSLFLGGIFRKAVSHPGFQRKPWLRPALDSEASRALVAVGEYVKVRLATKEGLDTSGVTIEGDEP